jgi:FlaA1/EpsC-like NDP-sugar epimerase
MFEGTGNASEFIDVEIDDLLGRERVSPLPQLMAQNITGKNVMVIGAGGSVGAEFALYEIEKKLNEYISKNGFKIKLYPLMGSVQRINRVENVIQAFNINTVYHAAAYKQVPLVEFNVVEGIRNNVFGTYYAAKAAINCGVETLVLVSTDKALRPTNIMSTSKRMAELALQSVSQADFNKTTRCCMCSLATY